MPADAFDVADDYELISLALDRSRLSRGGHGVVRDLAALAVVAAGRQPRARSMDLLIATTAHAHAARLYTRNGSDFDGLGDLIDLVTI